MAFNFTGKVALITGGASGIGLRYAKELLRNGAKGVTLADVEPKYGDTALEEIKKEFGADRAIFVKTDVADIQQFDGAFKETLEKYKNIDILFNNAGILNDAIWEKEIAINMNGTVHGMILGLDNYLHKYKQGPEGVIVNTSSITGIIPVGSIPIYCGTKSAVIAMTRSWGVEDHYQRTKVKVICICPGVTATPLFLDISGRNLGPDYEKWFTDNANKEEPMQEPEDVAKEALKVITTAPNGTTWVIQRKEPAYEYILPERR